ncbi:MAG: maleylpyruvate isomerase family mycothiol-dependent enzyme [Actinomycetota bacterium]|nr:maleylpyruvate isomerase family mycothiol-dependent enzyme [Actinomycetota bacterium]
MNGSPTIDAAAIAALAHGEAMGLLETELQRTLDMLDGLDVDAWAARTDCPDWDVRQMYLHVLGACAGSASIREGLHQMRAASARRKREGGPLEASLSAVQVAERAALSPAELVQQLRAIAGPTVKGRRRIPGFIRKGVKIGVDGPVVEKWKVGYLVDTIYLRDLWMHRIDACRATGNAMVLTAAHDGRIVADVVGEWARRHGKPFDLELAGAAGGRFRAGDGEEINLDAVEFCRALAGRAPAPGLLATIVPF